MNFLTWPDSSTRDLGTRLLRFSQTYEFWNSKANWQLRFFAAVNHLNGPLRKQNFTSRGSKSHSLWLVDFVPPTSFCGENSKFTPNNHIQVQKDKENVVVSCLCPPWTRKWGYLTIIPWAQMASESIAHHWGRRPNLLLIQGPWGWEE